MNPLVTALMAAARHRSFVYESALTASNVHIATRDGEAMFWIEGTDLSAYAGTDAGSTPYRIVLTDSSGNEAVAYGGAVGGGKTLAADGARSFDILSGSPAISGDTITFLSGESGIVIDGNYATLNSLYEFDITISGFAGSYIAFSFGGGGFPRHTSDGNKTFFRTADNDDIYGFGMSLTSETTVTVNSVRKLTDIPATGLHLMSSKNGTTRNMKTTDASFNPNDVTNIKIYAA